MQMTREQVSALAKRRKCPRCDGDKTMNTGLCRSCRTKLPDNMRAAVENIPDKDAFTVGQALRQAANYFNVHFASVRKFGGGKKR